jgi:phospholipase/carboxylesterase
MEPKITQHLSSNLAGWNKKSPIVILLHGYGSNMRDLPSLMNFLPGLPWISLQAPLDAGNGGFCWAPRKVPSNPEKADVEQGTARVWDWIDANLPADAPLVVIGFSQGGLMATQLLRTRPSRLKATVILAGFVIGAGQPGDNELESAKPKVYYGRGLEDEIISPEAVARTESWLHRCTTPMIRRYERLGHSINEEQMADVSEYLESVL